MAPERRVYWLEQQPASIPSIHSTLAEDFYVILTAVEPDGSATVKIHHNPLVNWIWIGGYTFMLGALLVLWPHPERRRPRRAKPMSWVPERVDEAHSPRVPRGARARGPAAAQHDGANAAVPDVPAGAGTMHGEW